MSDDITVHDTTETEAAKEAVIQHLDSTPNEELRALIEEWRQYAEGHTGPAKSNFLQAADELEAVIDE